jgi:hypothetical protein
MRHRTRSSPEAPHGQRGRRDHEPGAPRRGVLVGQEGTVIRRPPNVGAFHFVRLSALRAAQLMRGCVAHVTWGEHKVITIAQVEVAMGKIVDVQPAKGGSQL